MICAECGKSVFASLGKQIGWWLGAFYSALSHVMLALTTLCEPDERPAHQVAKLQQSDGSGESWPSATTQVAEHGARGGYRKRTFESARRGGGRTNDERGSLELQSKRPLGLLRSSAILIHDHFEGARLAPATTSFPRVTTGLGPLSRLFAIARSPVCTSAGATV